MIKKTPHFLISLIFLISSSSYAQLDYTWINPHPIGWDLNAITFSDAETGWAVGKQGTVILSANGGENWRAYDLRTDQELTDICFVDRRHGWISGVKGSVYYTTNGGRYWGEYKLPFKHPIAGIHFLNTDTGFAITSDGLVYESTDGGQYWETVWGLENGSFTDICFVDSLRGWIIGMDGVVERTIDGGNVWTHETLPSKKNFDYAFHMHGVHFIDAFTGWAVGEEGRIVRTQNGGRVWREQLSGKENTTFRDVFFQDKKHGWTVGEGGTLLYTEDGGELWLQIPIQAKLKTPLAIHAICESPLHKIWIAGERAFLKYDVQRNQNWVDVSSDTRKDLRQAWFFPGRRDHPYLLTADGELLRKTDRFQVCAFPEKVNFRKVLFTDRSHGFLLAKKDKLWYSEDGGASWAKVDLGNYTGRFYDIAFSDEKHGWIIGAKGLLLLTEDGGKSWRRGFVDSGEDLWQIQFANEQRVWIMSLQGEVWHSEDAGKNWKAVESPRKTVLTSMHLIGESGKKMAVITADGMYWCTSNRGKSWRQQLIAVDSRLVKLKFRNEKEGIILTAGNKYFYTQNGGKKWKQAFLPSFAQPKDVVFVRNQAIIIGDNGFIISLKW